MRANVEHGHARSDEGRNIAQLLPLISPEPAGVNAGPRHPEEAAIDARENRDWKLPGEQAERKAHETSERPLCGKEVVDHAGVRPALSCVAVLALAS